MASDATELTAKVDAVLKFIDAPELALRNMAISLSEPPLWATITSASPSPSASPTVMEAGKADVVAKSCRAAKLSELLIDVLRKTPILPPLLLVPLIRSGKPSPLRSAAAMPWLNEPPVAKSTRAAKLMVVVLLVLRNTDIALELYVIVARSGQPSAVRSAITKLRGPELTDTSCLVPNAIAAEVLLLRNIEIVFALELQTAISGLPSRFKSPTARPHGALPEPTKKSCRVAKEMLPTLLVFRKTEMELSISFETITSSLPSPLRSATATSNGRVPAEKFCLAAKLIVPPVLVLRNTESEFVNLMVFKRSILPSPSKSPNAMSYGLLSIAPVLMSTLGAKSAAVTKPLFGE